MNKHPILTGLLGGCITVIVVFIIILISHKQQQIFNPVYIVTSQYKVNNTILNNIKNNEVKDKLAEVERLNEKGVILTPQEYTSHISTFYNNILVSDKNLKWTKTTFEVRILCGLLCFFEKAFWKLWNIYDFLYSQVVQFLAPI